MHVIALPGHPGIPGEEEASLCSDDDGVVMMRVDLDDRYILIGLVGRARCKRRKDIGPKLGPRCPSVGTLHDTFAKLIFAVSVARADVNDTGIGWIELDRSNTLRDEILGLP